MSDFARNGMTSEEFAEHMALVGCSSAVERLPVKQMVEGSIPSAPESPGTDILRTALYENASILVRAHILLNHPSDFEDCDCEVARKCRQVYAAFDEMSRG